MFCPVGIKMLEQKMFAKIWWFIRRAIKIIAFEAVCILHHIGAWVSIKIDRCWRWAIDTWWNKSALVMKMVKPSGTAFVYKWFI